MAALGDAARTALEELMRTEGYEYQSDFARRYRAEGRAEGRAQALLMILEARGLEVTADQRERILGSTDLDELDGWLRKAATVACAGELFA